MANIINFSILNLFLFIISFCRGIIIVLLNVNSMNGSQEMMTERINQILIVGI